MIVYVDELLVKNFIMTYLILVITGEILIKKYRKRDLIYGSIISSIITLISFIFDVENNVILKASTLFIVLTLSFKTKNIRDFIIESTFILAITFLVGGVIKSSLNTYYEIIVCGVISIIAMKKYNEYYKKKKWQIRNQYKLKFKIDNREIELKAFLDTGNFLLSNFEKEAVVIVSKDAIKNKVSNSIINLLENGKIEDLSFNVLKNIRPINYSVLNTEIKMMYGLKVKNINVEGENIAICRDAVITLSKNKVLESDAIIGINLLEGGICDGNSSYVKAESEKIVC